MEDKQKAYKVVSNSDLTGSNSAFGGCLGGAVFLPHPVILNKLTKIITLKTIFKIFILLPPGY